MQGDSSCPFKGNRYVTEANPDHAAQAQVSPDENYPSNVQNCKNFFKVSCFKPLNSEVVFCTAKLTDRSSGIPFTGTSW